MGYAMRISRLTIDKLGVKLYDKVSAVVAELVSNSYDADATQVTVTAPMGAYLASKAGGQVTDKGHIIQVCDNGIGMVPDEINQFYLRVGAERRREQVPGRGDKSPKYERRVMGRKGVGKLAPFGICHVIEVLSSGGEKTTHITEDGVQEGYLTAHFILDDRDILKDTEIDYEPKAGDWDGTLSETTGTTITLREFAYRRVPDAPTFARQLAQRFGLSTQNWAITLRDATKRMGNSDYETRLDCFAVATMANTRITFQGLADANMSMPVQDASRFRAVDPNGDELTALTAGFKHDDRFFPLTGWTAYAKEPYKDDLMAGVRIYCRGKIAAQTHIFNRKAGFTGEHNIRSYLVGELHADWLDEEEDLIQTDRRDILWSHELGQAFERWGHKVISQMGQMTRDPMRQQTQARFLEVGQVQMRIEEAFPSPDQGDIHAKAQELARRLGKTIRADEVEDAEVVKPIVDLTLILAPHIMLDEKLKEASNAETTIGVLSGILRTARLAELSSFGRIAEERLKVIEKVQSLKDAPGTVELQLQELLTHAPWLINPQWAPITANQSFKRLKHELKAFYKQQTGQDMILDLDDIQGTNRRPDFVLSSQDNGLQIIEIKKPGHFLNNEEMDRIVSYRQTMKAFFEDPAQREFQYLFKSFHMTLVCDGLDLTGVWNDAFEGYVNEGILTHINWNIFLLRTERMHQDFLAEARRQNRYVASDA